ncbi:MAG: glycoside hydrolase 100 family protein [Coleofasciculus sp. D1-CHI-01]|uniref:glycoside hydrolase 100 family protein n=1 Tax=Coleofasciculus sp. D1-CHI-01 TaxID=3068482 RepID=UPI0032F43E88
MTGGSWPVLLWSLTAAAIKTQRVELAKKAIETAEEYLLDDEWPEYYDGDMGETIGREARLYQTWTIAGYLVANYLIQNPEHLNLMSFNDNPQVGIRAGFVVWFEVGFLI